MYYLTYWDADGNSFDYPVTEQEIITAMANYFCQQDDESFQTVRSTLSELYDNGSLDLDWMANHYTQYITKFFEEDAFSI